MIDKTRKIRMTCAALAACATSLMAATEPPSLLWKVERDGAPASYVMGTIHLPDTTVFRMRDTVLQLLDRSRVYYGELDLDSVKGAAMNMGAMLLPSGTTLRSFYHDSDWVHIDALLKDRLGAMAMMTSRMKPSTVLVMVMQQSMQATASTTIDEFLWRRAGRSNVTRRGIERVEEQMTVLDSLPPEALAEFARDPKAFDSSIVALRDAYVGEDLEKVAAAAQDVEGYEDFATQLNDDRNVVMADRVDADLRRGGTFVAVGAAHLPGPKGLLHLLRDRGYRVTPVMGGTRRNVLR